MKQLNTFGYCDPMKNTKHYGEGKPGQEESSVQEPVMVLKF